MTIITSSVDLPLLERLPQLWTDSFTWVMNHSTQIMLATLLGAVIVVVLLGAKWFGKRLCERDPKKRSLAIDHWRGAVENAAMVHDRSRCTDRCALRPRAR